MNSTQTALAEYVQGRLDVDEAQLREMTMFRTDHFLRDVYAKRKLIELAVSDLADDETDWQAWQTLRLLGWMFSDRSDYLAEWRPE